MSGGLVWEKKKETPYVPMVLAHGDYVFWVTDKENLAVCAEAKTGKVYGLNSSGWTPKALTIDYLKGKNIDKIFRALELVSAERRKRIGTSQMNKFLESVDFTRASVPHRQQVKIFYMTQAYASPPTFILITDKDVKLHFSYERFLQNQIRQKFGFVGTPIWIKNRAR